MLSLSIGLSGLQVAQQSIDLIGANIANASTQGYHRQDVRVAPVEFYSQGTRSVGGAQIVEIRRAVDTLLEREITRQTSLLGQASEEADALTSVEGALGDVGTGDLGGALSKFYGALKQLAAQPGSVAMQQQAVSAANALAGQFRTLRQFLSDMADQTQQKTSDVVQQVNQLSENIATLNGQIADTLNRGGSANLLLDRRDQAVQDLASLTDVEVLSRQDMPGVVDVVVGGSPIVMGNRHVDLQTISADDDTVRVCLKGSPIATVDVGEGRLSGLLNLKNHILSGLSQQVDDLAANVIDGINRLHVQGISQDGPFAELQGAVKLEGTLDGWGAGITAGDLSVRVTNTTTGAVTRSTIHVDPATDTLATVAAKLDAVGGITASVASSSMRIVADTGYRFDFAPALLPQPDSQSLTGTSQPTIGGAFGGSSNQTYSFQVQGTGEVGLSGALSLVARNEAGETIKTLNLGAGYAAGDALDIGNGITVSLNAGQLNNGDSFQVRALADSDPTGFLAAAGINTFFSGSSADTMTVRKEFLDDPGKIACSGSDASDNAIVLRMAALADNAAGSPDVQTPGDRYQNFVTSLGQQVSDTQARQDNLQAVVDQLSVQRDRVSSVDVNEESAKLLVLERMYQSVAKFIDVQNSSLKYLMDTV